MKRWHFLFAFMQLIFLTDVSAFTHSWTEILSDNKSTTGWTLSTDIGINGILGNPQWAYGPIGASGAFTPMEPWLAWTPPYSPMFVSEPLNGQPSDYNGYSFAWTWTDSNGSYKQTAVATGIRKIPLSYNFHVVSSGEHPTIGWSNDDLNFSQYRIRILNPSTEALLYEVSLDRAQFGAHPVYTISGFAFMPGVSYLLRIETRQYWKPDIYSTPDGVIPMVLNRSTLYVPYTNSVIETKKRSMTWLFPLLLD